MSAYVSGSTIFGCCIVLFCTTQPASKTAPIQSQTPGINIQVSPTISMDAKGITITNHSDLALIKELLKEFLTATHQQAKSTYLIAETQAKSSLKSLCLYVVSHKCAVAGAVIGAGYATALLLHAWYNYYLANSFLWGNWLAHLPDEELITQSYALIKELQKRYMSQTEPTNYIAPFASFLKNIEEEITNLERYTALCRLVTALKAPILFPGIQHKQIVATQLLRRSKLLKQIFISWTADQNSLASTRYFAYQNTRNLWLLDNLKLQMLQKPLYYINKLLNYFAL